MTSREQIHSRYVKRAGTTAHGCDHPNPEVGQQQTYPVQQYVWFHVGLTWNVEIGLTALIDGAPLPKPVIKNVSLPDQNPGIQVTVGKLPGSSMTAYLAQVTVDELFFWGGGGGETWLSNLEINLMNFVLRN